MFKVVAFRPNGNFEVFDFSNRKEARAKRKELLNTHGFLIVKVVKF